MKISYLKFGKKGQPIVFLHGWQASSQSFSPLVPFLHQNYHLFLLDLPGFGKSDFPPLNFSSFDYAKVIIEWIKKRRLKKTILAGHSFGGKVAAIVAAEHPDLISKLILLAPAGVPHPEKFYQYKKIVPFCLLKIIAPIFRSIFASYDYKQAGRLLPVFKTIVKEDLRLVFPKINIPTLIIWGKNDKELPIEDGIKIHRLIKKSQLAIILGDHFPFWNNPQKTAKLIHQFIRNEKD